MKKLLVTGANGFVGRNIVAGIKNNYEIIGCGRNLPNVHYGSRFVKWDISMMDEPCELSNEIIDVIVHAAASLEKDNLSNELIHTNCEGALNVLKFAIRHKVKVIVNISSLPVVGLNHDVPITEKAVARPSSMYHASKAAGEMILGQACHYGIRVISLRVPSPIGPNMPIRTIVPIFIQHALKDKDIQIYGEGTRKQNYLDVRDLAYAINKIIENSEVEGIYNIGAKNVVSNLDFAQKCIDVLGSNSKLRLLGTDGGDSIDWSTDDSKLRSEIGEYQRYSMERSILDIAREMKNENTVF